MAAFQPPHPQPHLAQANVHNPANIMQTIELHPSIAPFSRIVYGAWRMNEGTDNSPKEALAKIHACLDIGITSFDHADIYGNYSCESLFGAALKCDILLKSDKYPLRTTKHYDTSPEHIRASVDASLQRLGIDAIDVLLLHRPDPFMHADDTGACLDALVQAGKIRAVGVSNFKPWDWSLLQASMQSPLVTNQIEINLLATNALTDGSLAQAQQLKAPPMAWSPLAGGKLFSDDAAANRLRPALQRIANQFNLSVDAVAVAWLLAHPARILPVMGTNNLARIAKLADAFKVDMPRETWYELLEHAVGGEVA
jgi:predicted oxidoreductase